MRFVNRPKSAQKARRFVALVAEVYDIAHVAETAVLLVSELATNATQHAHDTNDQSFTVAVSRCGDRVRVEVRDGSPRPPAARYFDAFEENGRGLYLVKELADEYGSYALPNGKAVWFELVARPCEQP
jgi:anti-sigma regulatory factor (Ser/Thr protein kinase)